MKKFASTTGLYNNFLKKVCLCNSNRWSKCHVFWFDSFNQAASIAYINIPSNEKQTLKSSERVELMGRKDVMKGGKKIFSRIQIAVIFAVRRQINTSVVNFVTCTQNETLYNL